jgi:hypothetical protein
MNKFEQALLKYKPNDIRFIFIAETPPKSDSERFFYFENVDRQDSLFLETMKCLYPTETSGVPTTVIRAKKRYFLEKFMQDGFYLIDSLEMPFEERYSSSQKIKLIRKGQDRLCNKVKALCSDKTSVILISATVFRANYEFLTNRGVAVINSEVIDFPGSGGQKKFKDKLQLLLSK